MLDNNTAHKSKDDSEANRKAMELASRIGGRLSISSTLLLYLSFLLYLLFKGINDLFLPINIAFLSCSFVAYILGRKLGEVVLYKDKFSIFRSIGLWILIHFVFSCSIGFGLYVSKGYSSNFPMENFLIAFNTFIRGVLPVILLGTLFAFMLDSQAYRLWSEKRIE